MKKLLLIYAVLCVVGFAIGTTVGSCRANADEANGDRIQTTTKRDCTLFTAANATKIFGEFRLNAGQTIEISHDTSTGQTNWWRVYTDSGELYTVTSCFKITPAMEAAVEKDAYFQARVAVANERIRTERATARRAARAAQLEKGASRGLEVLSVQAKVTEANAVWSRFAWILKVRNTTGQTQTFDATIEFRDSGGFVVDDDRVWDVKITPRFEKTLTGYALIDASVADSVAEVGAKLRRR